MEHYEALHNQRAFTYQLCQQHFSCNCAVASLTYSLKKNSQQNILLFKYTVKFTAFQIHTNFKITQLFKNIFGDSAIILIVNKYWAQTK